MQGSLVTSFIFFLLFFIIFFSIIKVFDTILCFISVFNHDFSIGLDLSTVSFQYRTQALVLQMH